MEYINYIEPGLMVLVPLLVLVGAALKRIESVPDNMIPAVLGVAGIILAGIWVLSSADIYTRKDLFAAILTAIVQGAFCAGAAVYSHQLKKQNDKGDK